MNTFHIFFLIIIGVIFGKTIHIFLELIFIHKKINYYFYFFISAFGATGFLISDFLLSIPLKEIYYQIIFRFLFLFIIISTVSWCFLFHKLYFKKSILPWFFLVSSLLIACTLPFNIFMSSPLIYVKSKFFGSSVIMHYPYPGIMFYICEINIFIFYTLISIFIFLKSKLSVKQKLIGTAAFIPGVLFLSDSILFFILTRNYPEITFQGSSINLIIICLFLLVIFLFPNFQNYFAVQDKLNEMRLKNKILEYEINKRTQEIEKKNEQRTNLFINLTHEIKTPLTLIQNSINSYIKENGNHEKITILKTNIDKLTTDINNFFDTQKFELNKIVYNHDEVINLSKVLDIAISLFSEYAQNMNCSIIRNITKNIYIKASLQAVDRIINNLLDNAVKYSGNPGIINVNLFSQSGRACIKVRNNGEGISKEKQKKIFEPYYQILKPKKNIQGMGMGLSIIKNIVNSLNGSINVSSMPGKYTEFIIELPISKKPEKIFDQDINLSKPYFDKIPNFQFNIGKIDPLKKTILIVEDNKSLLAFLVDALRNDFNVLFAFNGLEGIEKYNQNKPDLILSDIMMDKMDGFQFYKEISNGVIEDSVPFLFMTAKSGLDDKLKGFTCGAFDYICKPFNMDELRLKIKSILLHIDGLIALNKKRITQRVLKAINQEEIILNKKEYPGILEPEINLNKIYIDYQFTLREKQVFVSLIDGKLNKEIASILNISLSSIKKYIFNIYRKLGVNNRIELSNFLYNNYLKTKYKLYNQKFN